MRRSPSRCESRRWRWAARSRCVPSCGPSDNADTTSTLGGSHEIHLSWILRRGEWDARSKSEQAAAMDECLAAGHHPGARSLRRLRVGRQDRPARLDRQGNGPFQVRPRQMVKNREKALDIVFLKYTFVHITDRS